MQTDSQGFTIVEVMLFLAISGLLLMGVFASSSTFVNGTRFTDSTRGLESFLQRQYEEVTSGVNSRGNSQCPSIPGITAPGTSECILLGKVIIFRTNMSSVETYNVVGSLSATAPSNSTLEATLSAYTPRTAPASRSDYSIPWDARFRRGQRQQDAQTVNAVAILRSPLSSQVGVYHFATTITGGNLTLTSANALTPAATNTAASYCINGQDGIVNTYRSAVTFENGRGSALINAQFDLPLTGAPC